MADALVFDDCGKYAMASAIGNDVVVGIGPAIALPDPCFDANVARVVDFILSSFVAVSI